VLETVSIVPTEMGFNNAFGRLYLFRRPVTDCRPY